MERPDRGFTLLELILALSIVAALLVIMFGGLRVGLAAWRRGEERAAVLEHGRGLADLLQRALAGAYPYRGTLAEDEAERVVFDGQPDRLIFVTLSAPFPAPAPIAFTAVSVSRDAQGLALREQVMPNRGPFDRLAPVLVDPAIVAVRFRYLGEDPGAWQDQWDMAAEDTLPRAIQIILATTAGGRSIEEPLIVPIRVTGQ
jgi:general secretion pathway protein J